MSAAQSQALNAEAALADLCLLYWHPLYAFLRRKGLSREDAEDLTQDFFAQRVLTRRIFCGAEPGHGKFRTWLLNSLKNFLCNDWNRHHARKRAGAHLHVPLDFSAAEESYAEEPFHTETPEKQFDRTWALTLLRHTFQQLKRNYAGKGQAALFEVLGCYLPGALNPAPYSVTAARIGKSEAATKMAVSRLKQEYGQLLRQEIERTVSSSGEVEAERQELLAILAG